MKSLLFAVLFCMQFSLQAQTDAQAKLPAFKILLSNGTYLTPERLEKNKPLVLIYFAPDCDHCSTLMTSFFKNINEFKDTEVVMVTFKPLEDVTRFVYDYAVSKYPNIKVGTEGTTFFIWNFYKLTNTPFVAIFNKQGNLQHSYRKISEAGMIVKDIKGM